MAQSREELLRKKREYAARIYAQERGRILDVNRASRERAKAENPDAYRDRVRRYNQTYHARNPAARARSVRDYYWRNRDACNRRTVDSIRRRKSCDPLLRITTTIRNRFVTILSRAKCAPTTEEAAQIHRWFEWLRKRGHADWKKPGVEIDHVVPVSKFNVAAPGAAQAINHWRNLFPLPKEQNRDKRAKIVPEYIRKVRKLAEEFLNE